MREWNELWPRLLWAFGGLSLFFGLLLSMVYWEEFSSWFVRYRIYFDDDMHARIERGRWRKTQARVRRGSNDSKEWRFDVDNRWVQDPLRDLLNAAALDRKNGVINTDQPRWERVRDVPKATVRKAR